MSFTINCNNCNSTQSLNNLINSQITKHNIIVDISFQDNDSPELDTIIFQCEKCKNTFEL